MYSVPNSDRDSFANKNDHPGGIWQLKTVSGEAFWNLQFFSTVYVMFSQKNGTVDVLFLPETHTLPFSKQVR